MSGNQKRTLRFFVIYILLLFAVAAVFLMVSYFAHSNETVERSYFEATQLLEQTQRELADLRNLHEQLTYERNSLDTDNFTLNNLVALRDMQIQEMQSTIEEAMALLEEMQERIEELEYSLNNGDGDEGE